MNWKVCIMCQEKIASIPQLSDQKRAAEVQEDPKLGHTDFSRVFASGPDGRIVVLVGVKGVYQFGLQQ